MEHRVAGADSNPYLLCALVLAAIDHGMERQLDPGYLNAKEGMAPLLEGIGPVDFPFTTEVDRTRAVVRLECA